MVLNLEEFQRPQFQGYVENIPPQRDYLLENIMPRRPVYDINFAYNVINGEYAQAASITGWNASAPLRDKRQLSQAFAEVAKIQHAQLLDEKELLAFNRPRSDEEQQAVIDYVYDTTDDLSAGVDDTEEFLRAQAIYNGRLIYNDDLNDIHLDIDFGLPEENTIDVTTPWTEEGATPLTDVQQAVRQFMRTNNRRRPVTMHMTSATEALLLQNEQIRTQIFGTNNGGRLLTNADVQNSFSALSLPNYQINDDVIIINDEEVPLLEDNKIVLIGADLGVTMIGPTVENDYNTGKFVQPIIEANPPRQTIIIGESAFPALQRPSGIVILNV